MGFVSWALGDWVSIIFCSTILLLFCAYGYIKNRVAKEVEINNEKQSNILLEAIRTNGGVGQLVIVTPLVENEVRYATIIEGKLFYIFKRKSEWSECGWHFYVTEFDLANSFCVVGDLLKYLTLIFITEEKGSYGETDMSVAANRILMARK